MIARRCTLTEATMKVCMKSMLQKTRIANRTHAAMGLQNACFADWSRSEHPVRFELPG